MKSVISSKLSIRSSVLVVAGAFGCSAATEHDPIRSDVGVASEEFKLLAAEHVNTYARALVERDAATLDRLLSSEVKERLGTYEGGVDRFMEKQRTTLLRAFPELERAGHGDSDGFEVTQVTAQEGVASVGLSYRGKPLERPFYFVQEGELYTLNVARPGFSRPLADGALPNDFYRITSNSEAQPQTIGCERGQSVQVQPAYYVGTYNNYDVSCPNVCGFWNGALFYGTYWQANADHYCDYNTWGTDVWVDWFGARCNDSC
jgi:hypothetical protein